MILRLMDRIHIIQYIAIIIYSVVSDARTLSVSSALNFMINCYDFDEIDWLDLQQLMVIIKEH